MKTKVPEKKAQSRKAGGGSWRDLRPRLEVRFVSHEHYADVKRVAKAGGLSVSSLICQLTLQAIDAAKAKGGLAKSA